MSSIFGNTSGSLFSQNNQQQQQQKPNLFGSLNTNTATSQSQQGGGLFGSSSQPQQQGGLFGSSQPQQQGGLFGSTSQPQQQGGLFGSTSKPAQTGGLFGSTQQSQPQQGGGLFGSTQQPQQQQGGGIFGSLGSTTNQQSQQQNQPQQGSSLFGNFGQPALQAPPNQQQGSVLGQSQGQGLFFQQPEKPREKSVQEQLQLAAFKWNPQMNMSPFQAYLYNSVPPEQAPFYGPTLQDDERKWEEALSKKPSPGAIPVLVRGFEQIALRMEMQSQSLNILRGRLHEINDGLNSLLQRHDLHISVKTVECRRKHQNLSRRCLGLAAKTQILRNRGYAMDSAEEDLRKKLMVLERSVFDPALNGRGEEIWARMVSVRERGRQLSREFERAGTSLTQEKGQVLDEEIMKRTKKILEDYSSQIGHLAKELEHIQKDWAEWEQSKPLAITNGSGR